MIRIYYTPDFAPKGAFWAKTESFDQSTWLGERGWMFFGRRSDPGLARKLEDAGVPFNSRWLPASTKLEVAAQIYGTVGVEFSPEAARLVSSSAEAQRDSWAQDATVDIPTPKGLEYRPYQRAGVAFALEAFARGQKGVIFGDEMGLGKTMQAIGVIAVTQPRRVLVACPASLKHNWLREIDKWIPSYRGRAVVLPDDATSLPNFDIVILNYDKVVGAKARAKALRESLLAARFDLVVFDEAHVLKNPKAQRTKIFLGAWERGALKEQGVAQHAERVLLLTGTPIQNKVRESITLLETIGAIPAVWDEKKFLFRYCGALQTAHGWTFDGATNLNELQSKLRSGWMVRRLKAEVATELPPKLRTVITIPYGGDDFEEFSLDLEPSERRYAREEEEQRDPLAGFEDAVRDLVGKKVGFEQVSSYRAMLAEHKQEAVVQHVSDLLNEDIDRKVIVFGHHQTMLNALQEAFPASIRIDGNTPPNQRQGLVDRFQTDPDVRVAILSTHAAGVGLTLTAANIVVFAEADWNPSWCVQAEDRAHRIGQEADVVTVQYLVLDNTLDARVLQTMVEKMDIADRALDRRAPARPVPAAPPPPAPAAPGRPAARRVAIKGRKDKEEEVFEITEERKAAVAEGLRTLSSACDGARTQDECGFNGQDARSPFVQDLVQLAYSGKLSDKQAAWGLRILRTYSKTQLAHLKERLYG